MVLALTAWLVVRYGGWNPGQYPEGFAYTNFPWFGADSPLDVRFSIALDGLSLWLFALTSLLMVVAVLVELGSDSTSGRRSTTGCC